MIYVQDKCIYLSTPHTGSRSTEAVLVGQCGGKRLSVTHHAKKYEMPYLLRYNEPAITTIRDPRDVVLNRYIYEYPNKIRRENHPLEEFIPTYARENYEGEYGSEFGSLMTMYRNYADVFFLFERGLKQIFDWIGCPDVNIPVVGSYDESSRKQVHTAGRITYDQISDRAKELINTHFAKDIEFYERVKNGC